MFRGTCAILALCIFVPSVSGDVFGTGANQFELDFVPISGDTGDLGSWLAGDGYTFTGVNRSDYRIGTFEITNDQWNKFKAELGVDVRGTPAIAYHNDPTFTAEDVPANQVSWYEAAQFINWLNTSTGHQAAYKFTGTQGQGGYALDTWGAAEAAGGTNLYRHKDAHYYMPTEDEWVKAAYWNGTNLQSYATKFGDTLHQGDGVSGTGWNYYTNEYAIDPLGPWPVGSGSEELNGTYDMMGNAWEYMEGPFSDPDYGTDSIRVFRGGSYDNVDLIAAASFRSETSASHEDRRLGFRVASEIPEPSSLVLLLIAGMGLLRKPRSLWQTMP